MKLDVQRAVTVLAVGSVLAAIGVGTGSTAPADVSSWAPSVSIVTSPADARTAQPQFGVAADRVVLSWIERTETAAALKFAERTATGWSPARAVAAGEAWFVNWADVPSVVPLADGSLAAHWLEKSAASTYAYDVKLAFSRDNGVSWTPPTTPHHDGTNTEHGFASLFQVAGKSLGLVWLDGRQMKEGDQPEGDRGAMTLRGATFDAAGSQTSESLIDDRVCECCPTAAAVTSEGPIVAFRNRTADEVRDIYVSRLVGSRWAPPVPVHDDKWRIAACPVNGPALSASGRAVAIAWFTGVGNAGHVYVAFSRDAGATFGAPTRVDEVGATGRVDVELLPDGSAAVSWIEFASQRSEFRIRRVTADGAKSRSTAVSAIAAGRSSGYPRMARHGNELLFAWTNPGTASHVRTAAARLP